MCNDIFLFPAFFTDFCLCPELTTAGKFNMFYNNLAA
jgi:hypothetical protein